MPPDWQGQQGCCRLLGRCYLCIAISPFFALSAPLSSTHQPPEASWETWGCNCVSPAPSFSLFHPFTCGSEPHFNSPCCTSAFIFLHSFIPSPYLYLPLARRAASSHVPDLLINNRSALAQRFLLLSMFSTLKLISDRASIFTGLHHSGDVTPSRTPLSSPPTTTLHCVCGSIPHSLFPPTSAVTKQFQGHLISLS